ncbi:MAG: RidA family protein [Planctomycetota bacterium]|jgi:enamine deaminase RidA (YjgF/YER057c/UK114 family)
MSLKPDADGPMGVAVVAANKIRGQMEYALKNVDAVLEKACMTRADVTSLRFFTTDVAGFLENYDVYVEWISVAGIRPPQSLLGVAALVMPELMVEIEATAAQ